MNKTERILGMLTRANELQNTTATMISVARANIADAENLLEVVRNNNSNILILSHKIDKANIISSINAKMQYF